MTVTRFRDSAHYWRTPLLPGADLLTAEYHDHEFTPHWHDAYTIPVIEEGAERYRYRATHYVAEAGSVPVINPGEVHTGSRAVDEGWRYRVMYVPIEYMHHLAHDIASCTQPLPWFDADVIRDPDLARRLSRAHQLLEAGAAGLPATAGTPQADPLAAESALLDALSTLLVRYGRTQPERVFRPAGDPRVATMKERLASNLATPLLLADLAAAVSLSPFHAARLFAEATGLPPHAWRNQIRLQRSLAPLRAGRPVAEVAAASGFVDQSHFTRHFRRMFGVPPGRWQAA
ncbi:AraC family transcriptional regulator [Paraburkholderia kururiensis]|uniref:AraC family transcriptional regulator n=1 Tax=Paraburkholderia kururiensis TaxID=984307 RepID=A0ABZ0WTJ8_9BURK|nr:AraC family transcriptional regulator [Paraburkholderia kururiensis]WQD80723.1 AraC family transcriptional regulator [Paraburkholderia kururiensis]